MDTKKFVMNGEPSSRNHLVAWITSLQKINVAYLNNKKDARSLVNALVKQEMNPKNSRVQVLFVCRVSPADRTPISISSVDHLKNRKDHFLRRRLMEYAEGQLEEMKKMRNDGWTPIRGMSTRVTGEDE